MTSDSKQPTNSTPPETSVTKASKQGFLCMWHGLTMSGLVRMIRHRPSFSMAYAPRWASIAALSVINSLQNAAESLLFSRKVRDTQIEHPPVFILGHWRSGTTLLHNLMTLDPEVTFPNLYQCMYPGHFLLTEKVMAPLTGWILPKTRPMDNIATTWKSALEDEIALALDCGISPYLMLAFHERREVYGRFFDPREMTDDERAVWRNSLLTLMKKLTIRKNRSIVVKSPSHTYRIPILLEMFPNAKFVYIHRDPYAVYQSTMHLRKTMFLENTLGPPSFKASVEETLFLYEKCIQTYEETKSLIPEGRLHELRFDDLEKDPTAEMKKIYEALNLPGWDQLVEPKVREEVAKLKSYKKNSFRMDRDTMVMLYDRLKWMFDLYGYPSRLDDAAVKQS